MAKLEIQNITLNYGQRTVIKGLSFRLSPGELLGLVGPNGCGKTSIIKSLSRVLTPNSGKISLDGKKLTETSRQELARIIGVVPQNPSLPETFTVFEVVILGRNPHLGLLSGESERDIAVVWQAMDRTGITPSGQKKNRGTFRRRETAGDDCPCAGTGTAGHPTG